jgi:hypothetical protein
MFADAFVTGRWIEDNLRTLQSQMRTRRNGSPHVLANFNAKGGVAGFEKQVSTQRNHLSAKAYGRFNQLGSRGEPTLLVIFFVIGQVGFGHNAQYFTFLYHYGRIDQGGVNAQRHTYNRYYVELTGVVQEHHQRHF